LSWRSGRIDRGFVYQHDGNVVPHRIDPAARAAFQALAIVLDHQRFLARRADEDFKQVWGDHGEYFTSWEAMRTAAGLQEAAEKLDPATSAAKAVNDSRASTAALKALRHPKADFFRSLLRDPTNGADAGLGRTVAASARQPLEESSLEQPEHQEADFLGSFLHAGQQVKFDGKIAKLFFASGFQAPANNVVVGRAGALPVLVPADVFGGEGRNLPTFEADHFARQNCLGRPLGPAQDSLRRGGIGKPHRGPAGAFQVGTIHRPTLDDQSVRWHGL